MVTIDGDGDNLKGFTEPLPSSDGDREEVELLVLSLNSFTSWAFEPLSVRCFEMLPLTSPPPPPPPPLPRPLETELADLGGCDERARRGRGGGGGGGGSGGGALVFWMLFFSS